MSDKAMSRMTDEHPDVSALKRIVEGRCKPSQVDEICYGAMNTIDALRAKVAELEAKCEELGRVPLSETQGIKLYHRAQAAEAQLATLREGLEGLDRCTRVYDEMQDDDEGEYVRWYEVRNLLTQTTNPVNSADSGGGGDSRQKDLPPDIAAQLQKIIQSKNTAQAIFPTASRQRTE